MERPAPRPRPHRSLLRSRSVRTLLVPALLVGLGACTYPRASQARPVSVAHDRPLETSLGRAADADPRRDEGPSGVLGLRTGGEALAARLELIERAEAAVDLQTYNLHADDSGQAVLRCLLRAADRGVRVRLLVDDMNVDGELDRFLSGLDAHEAFEVRLFHAFPRGPVRALARYTDLAFRFRRQNCRMHNKLLMVDGAVAITGGRNIGDKYFDVRPEGGFHDLDVLLTGEVVPRLAEGFDAYWNSEHATPMEAFVHLDHGFDALAYVRGQIEETWRSRGRSEYAAHLRDSLVVERLLAGELAMTRAEMTAVVDPIEKASGRPLPDGERLFDRLGDLVGPPEQELLIVSPYFVPGRAGVDNLVALVDRGVRVAVLTNSLAANNVPLVHTGYAHHRRRLLEGGVELYEMRRPAPEEEPDSSSGLFGSSHSTLHAKALFLDRRHVYIGSMNLDPRSVDRNTEVGVVIHGELVGEHSAEGFDELVAGPTCWRLGLDEGGSLTWSGEVDGRPVVLDREPGLDTLIEAQLWFFGLLPIESQL